MSLTMEDFHKMHGIEENPRAKMGSNNPPSPIERGHECARRLNAFLDETPVIQTAEEAKAMTTLVKSAKNHLDDIESDRVAQVKPLNDRVSAINAETKAGRSLLEKLWNAARSRLTDYAKAEEAKRIAEANRLAAEAAEKERVAREAEAKEKEAGENAAAGELGVNLLEATAVADQAFSEFGKADRAAARAINAIPVKMKDAYGGRALSLRTKEILHIENLTDAIGELGLTADIESAVLKSARAFKSLNKRLPKGITATTERAV